VVVGAREVRLSVSGLIVVATVARWVFLLGVLWLFLDHGIAWPWWLVVVCVTGPGVVRSS